MNKRQLVNDMLPILQDYMVSRIPYKHIITNEIKYMNGFEWFISNGRDTHYDGRVMWEAVEDSKALRLLYDHD